MTKRRVGVASELGRVGRPIHSRRWTQLAAAGLATSASVSIPTVSAQDVDPYLSFGVFVSHTFGAKQPLGVGFEARAGVHDGSVNRHCAAPNPFYFGGGALRFEWFPESHTQMTLVAQAGRAFALTAAHGELGLGYRLSGDRSLSTLLGAELDLTYAALALRADPLRGEVSPALGALFPSVAMPLSFSCATPGRPLRAEHGFAALPVLFAAASEARFPDGSLPCGNSLRQAADVWRRRAQTELASVPAFTELAEQLHHIGAPRELIARCHQAARDELHHALLAAEHCASLDNASIEIRYERDTARLPLSGMDALVRLAVESWADGCLGEGIAAECARQEALLASDEKVRANQSIIAKDEAQHAELAWDVLAWSLGAGGGEVRHALQAVKQASSAEASSVEGDGLEAFGIASRARFDRVAAAHRVQGKQRLERLLVT